MVEFKFSAKKKKKKGSIVKRRSLSKKSQKIILAFVFALFALIGCLATYFLGVRPLLKTLDAREWEEVPCKILSARVKSHEGDDSTTYSIDIVYEYDYEGKTYQSKRYDFIGGSSSGYKGKARVVEAYKRAENPLCYVNPDNPKEAVLKRGFHLGLLIGLFGVPFLAIGLGGLIWIISGGLNKTGDREQWLPKAEGVAATTELPVSGDSIGSVILKSKSPFKKLMGALLVAGIWNGIISVFLFQVVQGWRHGEPGWFLTLFMIPFVIVGLALIIFVIYSFLALFNPRLRLMISSAEIPLGGSLEVKWQFSGRADKIEKFSLSLTGREEARYRRGTKTYTDRNTFFNMEFFSTEDTGQTGFGAAGLVIPADSIHSFEAENNKIIWQLKARGQIAHWPDVIQDYKIVVTGA